MQTVHAEVEGMVKKYIRNIVIVHACSFQGSKDVNSFIILKEREKYTIEIFVGIFNT